MSRTVSFAEGTNVSDSPSKLFNHSSAHSSTKYNLENRRGELRFNMHKKCTSLAHDDFMHRFFPARTNTRSARSISNIFTKVDEASNEDDMYQSLPEVLNKSGLFPEHSFVATPWKRDKADSTKQTVDLGMYPSNLAPKPPPDGSYARMDWSTVDIPIECKDTPTEEDPFDDDASDAVPTAVKRKAALGQLLSYVELVYRYQQREHVYLITILGDYARIIRVDHSGLFTTKKFNYKEEGEKLIEFLWHFSRSSRSQRGHDSTAVRVSPTSRLGKEMWNLAQPPQPDEPGHSPESEESRKADDRDYIRAAFKKSLDPRWPWWRLEVPVVENEGTPEETRTVKRFFVGKPHFAAPGVAGRATRGYVAVPLTTKGQVDGPFVYLKDAWRVDRPGIEKEGSILKELNELKIKYVPTLVCHGDIPGQVTISQDIWPEYHPDSPECPLKRHQHYRLVVKEVGKPLDAFENGLQLVSALFCCIYAHGAAYNAGIIHRDISAGNILLWFDDEGGWQGMLNDWELAKRVPTDDTSSGGRQPDRTGTWQFMSAHALNNRFRAIIVPDELESFFHVLLYYAIRYLPHNCPDSAVGKFLQLYFDDYTDGDGQFNCGQMKYFAMKTGEIDLNLLAGKKDEDKATHEPVAPLRFHLPDSESDHPIQTMLETMLRWFAAYYALDKPKAEPSQSQGSGPSSKSSGSRSLPKGISALANQVKQSMASPAEPQVAASVVRAPDPEAKMLETHDAMLGLFANELSEPRADNWPDEDKGLDKRPKKGYEHPKDAIPASSTQVTLGSGRTGTTGTKRRGTDQDENPRTPKKRSQS